MTEPQTVTADELRALLSDPHGTALVLVEGRVEVAHAGGSDGDEHQGALEVISRDELLARVGEDAADAELVEQAAALTAAVQQLGG